MPNASEASSDFFRCGNGLCLHESATRLRTGHAHASRLGERATTGLDLATRGKAGREKHTTGPFYTFLAYAVLHNLYIGARAR